MIRTVQASGTLSRWALPTLRDVLTLLATAISQEPVGFAISKTKPERTEVRTTNDTTNRVFVILSSAVQNSSHLA